eukprot:6130042-Pyramimonas_sp.AAC.1
MRPPHTSTQSDSVGSVLSGRDADGRTAPTERSVPQPFQSPSPASNPLRSPAPLVLPPNLATSARLASLVSRGLVRDVRAAGRD